MKHIRLIIVTALLSMACAAVAQTDADNLYLEGQKLQQTMSIAKQNEAIKKFKQAKVLYTSSSKQTMCDNQITLCNKNISSIKASAAKRKAQETKKEETVVEEQPKEEVVEETHKDVQLSLSESALQFKRKPKDGATQSVVVTCNYDDWEATSNSDWVTIYRAAGKFSVEVGENTGDEERSCVVRVKCGDTEADLVINQKGPSALDKAKDKVKKTIDKI